MKSAYYGRMRLGRCVKVSPLRTSIFSFVASRWRLMLVWPKWPGWIYSTCPSGVEGSRSKRSITGSWPKTIIDLIHSSPHNPISQLHVCDVVIGFLPRCALANFNIAWKKPVPEYFHAPRLFCWIFQDTRKKGLGIWSDSVWACLVKIASLSVSWPLLETCKPAQLLKSQPCSDPSVITDRNCI